MANQHLWISMDFNEFSLNFNGFGCDVRDLNGFALEVLRLQSNSMDFLWNSMDFLWISMDFFWISMDFLWNSLDFLWISMDSLET